MQIAPEDFAIIADGLRAHPDVLAIDLVHQTLRLREAPRARDIDAAIVLNYRPDLLEDAVNAMMHTIETGDENDVILAEHALEVLDTYIRAIVIGNELSAPQNTLVA